MRIELSFCLCDANDRGHPAIPGQIRAAIRDRFR
jgi:hypothetical protein